MNKRQNPEKTSPIPSIGVSGLLFNNCGQVLLIKRNQPPAKGLWSLPGGRLEPGETLIDACRREFFEETNLEVDAHHIVALVERQIEGFHYIIIDYMVTLKDEEKCVPLPQSDVTDAKWINLADLDRYDVVEGLRDIIARAHHFKINGILGGLHENNRDGTDFILPVYGSI